MKLFLSRLHFPVHTLGPGARVGVWLQGCSIRCPGCISLDTWAPGRGETSVAAVLEAVAPWLPKADGVTVSGGEPFDQPEALRALLLGLRERTAGDVLVFTGYPYEALGGRLEACAGLIDALVTDPFEVSRPQTLALRGSDNQRLHRLTPLGQARFGVYERPLGPEDRRLDVHFDADGTVWMAGIPQRGDLQRLSSLLAAGGHAAQTTEGALHPKRQQP